MVLTALLTLTATGLAEEVVQQVASRRIFFGHQSVGANILDGVNEVSAGKLRIREGRTSALLASPGFLHARIGQNESSRSKVADFEAALASLGGAVDIAFFKFCSVDFTAQTDVEALLADDLATLHRLEAKHPKVTFVHLTVPLTVVPRGAGADGSTQTYAHQGQTLPALMNEYSDDGQHLNSVGQRRVAEALLTFLARLP